VKTVIEWKKYKDDKPEFDKQIAVVCHDGQVVLIELHEFTNIHQKKYIEVCAPDYIDGFEYEVNIEESDINLWAYFSGDEVET
jgi:hypothetical protein